MSILASLNKAYERLAIRHEVPSFGFSSEKISFVISLNPDGSLARAPIDLRDSSGKKPVPRMMSVPQPVKRTSGIAPNFLWDKSSYVLGLTSGDGKRLKDEHKAFIDFHDRLLRDSQDDGLKAFIAFLQSWKPDDLEYLDWPEQIKTDIKDQNIIFALEEERRKDIYIHDRPAAKELWARLSSESEKSEAVCLITGMRSPIARLHPSIKGVWGGQSSGGAIVSFNLDAFSSYGHEQGDNAPVSEAAAFAYTTALNKFLEKGSANRIQIGDTSTVFWADAADADAARDAEDIFGSFFQIDEDAESRNEIKPILEKIRAGQPIGEIAPRLSRGVRFYVLGLAPNAARLSIRFWIENDFGDLARNYQQYLNDMRIDPQDRNHAVALWQYLRETAVLGKSENVPPNLAGEWMRAILTGRPYPRTLLATVLMRIRSDKEVNARRISMMKAVLVRNFNMTKEAPVAFDPENRNKGYLLGRLFAAYEHVQGAALGGNVNATIKDKFYSSASAQPRKVFALLESGSANHLSKLGKQKPGYKVTLEKQIGSIMDMMSPSGDPFPASLSSQEQALFGLGYYHQRNEFFKSKSSDTPLEKDSVQ